MRRAVAVMVEWWLRNLVVLGLNYVSLNTNVINGD